MTSVTLKPSLFQKLQPLLNRTIALLALAMVVATACVYPLRLSDTRLFRLEAWAQSLGVVKLYHEQLRPWLLFNHSPLVIKESMLLALGALLLGCFAMAHLTRNPSNIGQGSRTFHPQSPALYIGGILLLGLLRLPFVETPYIALRTLLLMTVCVAAPGAVILSGQGRVVWQRLPALILGIGYVLAVISLLQHLGRTDGWLPNLLAEPRNRMGSLIGHNTGLSSYLIFPTLIATWGVLLGRGPFRLASGLFLPLVLFVILSAQSRSAWLALAIAGPLGIAGILRSAGKRLGRREILAMAGLGAVVLLAGTAFPSINPLARQVTPLRERLVNDVFNLDQLRRETRWRVLFAGAPLVAQAPILGHGPGQFQWVYPPAQGRFLNKYLFETEAYTIKRTDIAHNDWLQFAIEFGLVGTGLGLMALGLLFRRTWSNWTSMPQGADKALIPAMLASVVGLMLQAIVDFPFHLAAHGWLCSLVLILASSRTTFFRTASVPPTAVSLTTSNHNPPQFRPAAALLLTALGAGLILVPVIFRITVVDWVSDAYYVGGNNHMATSRALPGQELERRRAALENARAHFRMANRVNQFHGQSYEAHALATLNMATIQVAMARNAREAGDQAGLSIALEAARSLAEASIAQANLAINLGELRWHYSYLNIARAYAMLWNLRMDQTDPLQVNLARSAATAYEAAFLYNPTDADLLLERAKFVEQPVINDPKLALEMRNLVWRVDPGAADIEFVDPIRNLAYLRKFDEARAGLDNLEQKFPQQWRVPVAKAELDWMEAVLLTPGLTTNSLNLDRRRELLDRARTSLDAAAAMVQGERPWIAYWRMQVAAAAFDWDTVLSSARTALRDRFIRPDARVLEVMTRAFIRGGQQALTKTLPSLKGDPEAQRFFQRYQMLYFGLPQGAYTLAIHAPNTVGVEPVEAILAIEVLLATGNRPLAGSLARELAKNARINRAVRDSLKPLIADAGTTITQPLTMAPNSFPIPPNPVR